MEWGQIRWNMPLESSPVIVQIGENTHGQTPGESFRLPDLWCLHLYGYDAELEIDGAVLPIHPGYIGITPPGSTALYRFFDRSPHFFVHFSMMVAGPTFPVPAMRDLGASYASMVEAFREALRFWPIHRQRSAVRLWDILWQLADVSRYDSASEEIPTPVRSALAFIDSHLHETLSIERLASDLGISHNHFTRVFRASQGCTPQQYIQNRRVSQARHLLMHSSMPLKAVAASIAIDDPQVFNKFVRHYLGRSPRRTRQEGATEVEVVK